MTGEDNPRTGALTVQPGSRVRYRVRGKEPQTVSIFNPGAPSQSSIQVDTALGKALMGRREGDEVDLEVHPMLPKRRVTIEAIE